MLATIAFLLVATAMALPQLVLIAMANVDDRSETEHRVMTREA